MSTQQIAAWQGDFGQTYTERNSRTVGQLDELYRNNYGSTRTSLNQRFLADIPCDAHILEVGCNVGNQLSLLQHMGYKRLAGIEIQHHALAIAQSQLPTASLVQASALQLPFPDNCFDMVFTSGVLIHIAPQNLPEAMGEIHRCTAKYIWGFEYYSPELTEVEYRGKRGLLWKSDYAKMYRERFSDLENVQTEQVRYVESANVDCMFLLAKGEQQRVR